MQGALQVGFTDVRSVELAPHLYEHNVQRFLKDPRVHLWHGYSDVLLPRMIRHVSRPITFWLDAHYSAGVTASSKPPLRRELELIAQHPVKTHTLLIDDLRLFEPEFGISPKEVMDFLTMINPKYTFSVAPSALEHLGPDILVATVRA